PRPASSSARRRPSPVRRPLRASRPCRRPLSPRPRPPRRRHRPHPQLRPPRHPWSGSRPSPSPRTSRRPRKATPPRRARRRSRRTQCPPSRGTTSSRTSHRRRTSIPSRATSNTPVTTGQSPRCPSPRPVTMARRPRCPPLRSPIRRRATSSTRVMPSRAIPSSRILSRVTSSTRAMPSRLSPAAVSPAGLRAASGLCPAGLRAAPRICAAGAHRRRSRAPRLPPGPAGRDGGRSRVPPGPAGSARCPRARGRSGRRRGRQRRRRRAARRRVTTSPAAPVPLRSLPSPATPFPIVPPALRPGDLIAVVAPSSPFEHVLAWVGLGWLATRYRVRFSRGLFARTGYLAGSDERRREELVAALTDPEVRAVLAARGGYGASRFVHDLSFASLAEHPRWIVGFSDITVLHVEASRAGVATIHGPHLTSVGRGDARAREALVRALEHPLAPRTYGGLGVVREGDAKGPLFGGNL